ncbi:hypothetical protein N7478_000702 [Penicillium angulare]|uniref:uncharacterized protein n=1 Tax=Penicillium angulare TaxID=116970 RepID=UPI002541BE40|nr:uncharacterized protein N7478_000702 [Penicillium angulare]KAJ5291451.1 hypothetical protein N7478_000702 [Penicillium angulare]
MVRPVLIFSALIALVHGKLNTSALVSNTCDLLSQWAQISPLNGSVSYVQNEQTSVMSLLPDCTNILEKAAVLCLSDSETCNQFSLSWAFSPSSKHVNSKNDERKLRRNVDVENRSCQYEDASSTAHSAIMAMSTPAQTISTLASTTGKVTASLEIPTGNEERCSSKGLVPTSAAYESLGSTAKIEGLSAEAGRACIIKLLDFNSTPRGKCYCSDNTTIDYVNGECEVYS